MRDLTPADRATEEVVRRYLGRLVLRYLPFALAVAVLLAIFALVPTKTPSSSSGAGYVAGSGSPAVTQPGTAASPPSAATPGAQTLSGSSTVASAPGSAPASASASTVAVPAQVGAAGQTESGTACGPNVRQVPWSAYSTLCVPKFTGNNGGATSYGVSATTINATFRISDSGEAGALAAAEPSLNQQAQSQYFQDLTTYVNFFNTQFELYGRRVVVKEFNGKGDWVQEYQSQDPQGAEADAATARGMGAFADISSAAVATTPLYAQYLASDHVISAGGVAGSDHYFSSNAPYAYAAGASVSRLDDWVPNVVCQRMKGLPAIFSGDPASTHVIRKFGLIFPTNPDFQIVGNAIKSALAACGAPSADTYEYAINLATMASDSVNAMAKMRSAGVTTVVCLCDTVVPKFLTSAASAQGFHPEWLTSGQADSLAQGYDQSQWAHAIGPAGSAVPPAKSEAYKVFLMASHGRQPVSTYYVAAYATAILFFDALQNAGPDLNPETFQQGFFALPPSLPGGQMGPWSFGADHWTSVAGAPIGWWNPSAISGQTNTAGAWVNCSGADGANHAWEPRSIYGTQGTQLECFK